MTLAAAPPVWQHPTEDGQHAATSIPSTVAGRVDWDTLPTEIASTAPREARGWRQRSYSTTPPGPPTDNVAGAVPAVHVGPGDPDARALYGNPQQAGNPGHAPDAFAPQAEAIHNEQHGANVIDSQTAPARARQGFTGEDNTRAAVQGRWLFGRLFDQWAEQRLGAVDKAPAAHLTAARPPTFGEDVAGGLPSPGGRWRARGMEGVGIQPNSVRLLPRPWDEQLVNDGSAVPGIDQAAVAGSAARARGWRL